MAKIPQIGGMLLEEVILHLIAVSGYKGVTETQNDPTLCIRKKDKALCVRGRGEMHQIDAIADFFLSPPLMFLLICLGYMKDNQDRCRALM